MAESAQAFVQVLHALVADDGAPGRLIGTQERAGFVQMNDGTVAIVIHPSLAGVALRERLREVLRLDPVHHLKLVIVGGGAGMRAVLSDVQPRLMARRMVQVFHLSDSGEVWAGRRSRVDSAMGQVLQRVGRNEGSPEASWQTLQGLAGPPPSDEERAAAAEHRSFVERFRDRRPWATYVLLGSIAATFGLQALWGGTEFIPTLVRMGANTDGSLAHEPWRLLSSAFLHAGPLHVLVNGYVLFALGTFIERIVGWQRFVVLYAVAAMVGSVASAVFSEAALSVGASGAIWGLLGAAGGLALRPSGVLPANLVGPLRRTAAINLLINLSVSFLPQVDMMAHLGGGVAGALLAASGVLTRGVTPLASATNDLGEASVSDRPRARRGWTAGAVFAALIMGSAVVIAVVTGRPWQITQPPTWSEHALGGGAVTLRAPALLGAPEAFMSERQSQFVLGSVLEDPLEVVVDLTPLAAEELLTGAFDRASWFMEQTPPSIEGAKATGEQAEVPGTLFPTYEQAYVYPNGLRATYRRQLRPDILVGIEVVYWPETPVPYGAQTVLEVLESLGPRDGAQ